MLYDIREETKHQCCFHIYRGALWMVIPDGHVVEKCCKCGNMRTVHIEHRLDRIPICKLSSLAHGW